MIADRPQKKIKWLVVKPPRPPQTNPKSGCCEHKDAQGKKMSNNP
jgi:hypothetical protein